MSAQSDGNSGRTYFWLRKIQSLTGIAPVGVFLFLHLFTNFFASKGGASFTQKADQIEEMPFLLLVEMGIVWIPILVHGSLGLYMIRDAQWSNLGSVSKASNTAYFLQRVTGIIAFIFIIAHFFQIRAQKPEEWTGAQLYNHTKIILDGPGGVIWSIIYIVGTLSAIYHFSNGIRTFCMSWGITIGERARKGALALSLLVGAVLTYFAAGSLYGFWTNPCYAPEASYFEGHLAKDRGLTPEDFVNDPSFKNCPTEITSKQQQEANHK